jgi:hypothetical protein
MPRRPRLLLAFLLGAALAGGARAAITPLEDAWEVALARVEFPGHELGRVSFEPCPGCPGIALQVDRDTRYLVGAARVPLSLAEFREAAALAPDPGNVPVYVFCASDTKVVTRLILDAPNR